MVVVLETNIKGIISGNGAALIQRKKNFGANKFRKAPAAFKKNKNACLYSLFH